MRWGKSERREVYNAFVCEVKREFCAAHTFEKIDTGSYCLIFYIFLLSIPSVSRLCLFVHIFSTLSVTTCNLYSLWRNAPALMIIFPNNAENCEALNHCIYGIIFSLSLSILPRNSLSHTHMLLLLFLCMERRKIHIKEQESIYFSSVCDFIIARLVARCINTNDRVYL